MKDEAWQEALYAFGLCGVVYGGWNFTVDWIMIITEKAIIHRHISI